MPKEMGFERGTIGIAGLTGSIYSRTRAPEGEASWTAVEMIKQAFPAARVVSATETVAHPRFQKSEEEVEFLRKGTAVAEAAMRAVIEYARAGVAERYVYAEMLKASAAAGGSMPIMIGWISGPLGNTYTRLEQPTFRKLAAGDVLALEIEGRWAGYIGQLDQQFSIGPAHQDLKDGMELAYESFNRVLVALKPGVTVGELVKVAEVSGMNGRGVASLTMHGRGTGDDGPLLTPRSRSEEIMAMELKENCCLIVKPSTRVDGRPNFGHWGDSVVVRKHGAERLGTRKQELYELGTA
jgi:Xaa-Pro aminopeptidase